MTQAKMNRTTMRARHALPRVTASAVAMLGALVASPTHAATQYTYDPTGRLTTAYYDDGSCVAYEYDANGNRTSFSNTAYGAPPLTWGSGQWGCPSWTP
jgi:uncharacterized protein RhaS with RHS repeats